MQDLNYMILNIKREGATWPPIMLINIYNQKPLHSNTNSIHEWTANWLHNHIPHHSIPTTITRDWNMRDLSWDDGVNTLNTHKRNPGVAQRTIIQTHKQAKCPHKRRQQWTHIYHQPSLHKWHHPKLQHNIKHPHQHWNQQPIWPSCTNIHHWAPTGGDTRHIGQGTQLETHRQRKILQGSQRHNQTQPRDSLQNSERFTQPEQKNHLRIQTRWSSWNDSKLPRTWRWGWSVLHEEIFNLLRLAADSRYHPKKWRTSITIAIQKLNCDYTLPCSYRLIQLLEVLGKALERAQVRWLAYIAAKYSFIPPSHYRGIPGKSAQDALLTVMNDVETAWHHNKVVSMLTYDIMGFFDTIPHAYLIHTMCTLHIPLL